ncbi:hypothetical protein C0971_01175 [Bacillus methanolicus]|nr:hypothetical protein C0971_01175 [Bacillus methanolicus]
MLLSFKVHLLSFREHLLPFKEQLLPFKEQLLPFKVLLLLFSRCLLRERTVEIALHKGVTRVSLVTLLQVPDNLFGRRMK